MEASHVVRKVMDQIYDEWLVLYQHSSCIFCDLILHSFSNTELSKSFENKTDVRNNVYYQHCKPAEYFIKVKEKQDQNQRADGCNIWCPNHSSTVHSTHQATDFYPDSFVNYVDMNQND